MKKKMYRTQQDTRWLQSSTVSPPKNEESRQSCKSERFMEDTRVLSLKLNHASPRSREARRARRRNGIGREECNHRVRRNINQGKSPPTRQAKRYIYPQGTFIKHDRSHRRYKNRRYTESVYRK